MAKDKKEDLDEKEQQPEPKKKSRMKWIIIGAAALIIIASGAGAGYYFFFSKKDVKATSAQQPVVVTIWPMEAFIINIADTNGERYLKVVIQLEVSDPTVVAELEQLKPRLRDSILDLLTPKTYKELMDLAGKQRLREDIAGRVNNILTKGKVTKVYITDFVVQ